MITKLQGDLLLATRNLGKIAELRQILAELEGIRLLTLADVGADFEVNETGTTYWENAALKAEAYAEAAGLVCIADDSGLEVDALDGAPGVYSKRYNPKPGASDFDRRRYLVENLSPHPQPWTARFRAMVAVKVPDEPVRFVEGKCEGYIIPEDRGSNGFGYDPIFFIPEMGRTMAELTDDQKNAVSHRGNAARAAIPVLKEIFHS